MASDPVVTLTARGAQHARASVRFPAGWPVFAGHFPGAPLVPGVYLLQAAQQALALVHGPLRLVAVRDARFWLPVGPDVALDYEIRWRAGADPLEADVAVTAAAGPVARFRLSLLPAAAP